MKKIIILAICIFATAFSAKSQDIITKKDGTEIKAKILSVNDTKIDYKLFDYQDGPEISLKVRDVASIIFQNGTIRTFENEEAKRIAEKGITTRMAYDDYKNLYNPKDYVHSSGDPYSPVGAGIASFFVPGLGQIINGQVGKGIGIFFGDGALMFTGILVAGLSATTDSQGKAVATPGGTVGCLACFAGALALEIWNIVDAVNVAKIKNLYHQDCEKLMAGSFDLKLLPSIQLANTAQGVQPAAGLTLALRF